jgi:hypothetical protein
MMKKQSKLTAALGQSLGLAGLLAIGTTAFIAEPSVAQSDRFFCAAVKIDGKKVPATYAFTPGQGYVPMIVWGRNDFVGSLSPAKRCHTVSRRFQRHYENRTLKYIRTGLFGNYPVICVANSKGGACPQNQILVTLNPGSNPGLVLSQLLDVRTRSSGRTIYLSGEDALFYEEGETYVDVEKWLASPASLDAETSQ